MTRAMSCLGVRKAPSAAHPANSRRRSGRCRRFARRTVAPRSAPSRAGAPPEPPGQGPHRSRPCAMPVGMPQRCLPANGPDAPEGHRRSIQRARRWCEMTRSWRTIQRVTGVYRPIDAGYDTGFVAIFDTSVPRRSRSRTAGAWSPVVGDPWSSPSGMHPCAIFP